MKLSEGTSNVLVVISVACAVAAVSFRFWDEIRGPRVQEVTQSPRKVDGASSYASSGYRLGPQNSRVTIVEFSDFECPFCAKAALGALQALRHEYPSDLAIVYRNAPLSQHRFAIPAAKAALCAGEQGRFEALHDLLFAKQDSLGLKSFSDFASEAGIPDSRVFEECQMRAGEWKSLQDDLEAVKKLEIRGTPSFLVGDKLYTGSPPVDEIRALLLAGR
jgi:protein-disulfide isomerase